MLKPTTPWSTFNRMKGVQEFFACVRHDGTWEDSARSYGAAINLCCMADRYPSDAMNDVMKLRHLEQAQWSIIHSSLMEKMYEAGLIK